MQRNRREYGMEVLTHLAPSCSKRKEKKRKEKKRKEKKKKGRTQFRKRNVDRKKKEKEERCTQDKTAKARQGKRPSSKMKQVACLLQFQPGRLAARRGTNGGNERDGALRKRRLQAREGLNAFCCADSLLSLFSLHFVLVGHSCLHPQHDSF